MRRDDKTLVVTRHPAMEQFLLTKGIIQPGKYIVAEHANPKMVMDRDVIGNIPLWLAAYCNSITTVNIVTPRNRRGCELSLDEMEEYFEGVHRYVVKEL